MNSIKRKVTKWERHEEQVEFQLPCYRKWKDLRVFKVCADNMVIQVPLDGVLNPCIELIEGSIDRAFDSDTQPSNKAEFDAALQKSWRKICDAYLIDIESKLNPNLDEQIETIFSNGNSHIINSAQEGQEDAQEAN